MKRLALLLVCVLCGCSAGSHPVKPPGPPPNKDFTISVTFNYDFTNFAACSSTVTKGCISGFAWGYLQGANAVPLKTSATTVCTGATQPEACTDSTNSQLPMGSLTFFVVANIVDNVGTVGQTAQGLSGTPTVVTAGAPTNVVVKVQ